MEVAGGFEVVRETDNVLKRTTTIFGNAIRILHVRDDQNRHPFKYWIFCGVRSKTINGFRRS
jgi:hypothetical protein